MLKKKSEIISAIDLGTSKTTCIICEIDEENNLEVIGFGHARAKGVKKGMIVNLEEALSSVKSAVEEAELMSDVTVGTAFIGVAGSHVKGVNSTGATLVKGKHNEIDNSDIQDVIEASQNVSIPEDREIIHLIPREFVVDRQEGITDPLGMTGNRLEVKVHIITGAISSVKNVIRCINKAGIEVKDIVSNQLASAQATAAQDEKELGVAVVDIGAGITDLAVFIEGRLEHTSVLPVGGDHFTNDIAVGLRTPIHESEKIKVKYADLREDIDDREIVMRLPGVGKNFREKVISTEILQDILLPRAEEMLMIINDELRSHRFDRDLNAGIILTGGGSLLRGLEDTAEKILNLPVRIGTPINMGGLSEVIDNPVFSSVVGILQYGFYNVASRHNSVFLNKNLADRFKDNFKVLFGKIFSEAHYG